MIAAEQTTASTPFAKLVELGDTLVGAYAGASTRQQRTFGTGELKWKNDGKPLKEWIAHFIAMPGTTAKTGTEDYTPIAEGDHVRYSVSGFKWGQVIRGQDELPAIAGFKRGQLASADVYTFTLSGWSAATDNPAGAKTAGFTVVEDRIVMTTDDEHERWVLNQIKKGGNTNAAKDYTITVRRIDSTTEKRWEQAADELFLLKPWENAATATAADDDAFEAF